jgi:hypothetical protein
VSSSLGRRGCYWLQAYMMSSVRARETRIEPATPARLEKKKNMPANVRMGSKFQYQHHGGHSTTAVALLVTD